ncbi:uncharacterized protein LOC135154209 [Lytechinus pictus]|uniref:uncharacterized protein LOC135154209 n=1 Tax=Lytechinus pictus TaxID=7653 RepID=UPI0030B9CEFB
MLGGREIELLRDCGCTHSLARTDLVDPNLVIPGETLEIKGLLAGTVVSVARVYLISKPYGIAGWVKVGLLDVLPVDLILGNELVDDVELVIPQATNQAASLVVTRSKTREESAKAAKQEEEINKLGTKTTNLFEKEEANNEKGQGNKRDEKGGEIDSGEGSESEENIVDKDLPFPSPQINCLDVERSKLIEAQQEDESLKSTWEKTVDEEETEQSRNCFYISDGVLMQKWASRNTNEEEVHRQVVVPRKFRMKLLEIAHDNLTGGHLGVKKTQQRLLQNFYWPGLFQDVAEYCKTCGPCQKCVGQSKRGKAKLVSVPVIGPPFRKVAMDIVGPLPRTKKGNRFILVVCDYSTRYPEAVPLSSIEAEKVADESVKIFSRVGIPEEILSEQGANFMSHLMKQLCASLGIKQMRTSPYHPQANGLVERFNASLKNMLKPYCLERDATWDDLIPFMLFAYREVPQESTGSSPFELLYGHRVRGPLDVVRETWTGEIPGNEGIVSYVLDMRERLGEMTKAAQINLSEAQTRQKVWNDMKARVQEIEVDQQVLVLLPTSNNKLIAKWQGPYRVIQKISDVNYAVEMGDKRKKHRVFHVNMLRPWRDRQDLVLFADIVDSEEDEDLETFVEPLTYDPNPSEVEIPDHLAAEQSEQLSVILDEYSDILSERPGRTDVTEHDLKTSTDRPIRQKAYRIPHTIKNKVKDELKEMLEAGIITESDSPYASPLVIVKKKDGALRLCVDYRKLNEVTEFDAYPMPNIEEIIDQLGQAKYITTMDLTKGYWQVPLTAAASKKSAFITPFGLYQFQVMPFGMQGAPATFQRLIDRVLRVASDYATAYIDDIIVFSKTWKEHLTHLREVLDRLRDAGLTVKPSKCKFARQEVLYLGFVLGGGSVRPEPAKIEAVVNSAQPVTKTDVRAFLGLTGYYRKFIPNYSKVATPLTDLTKKSEPRLVKWNDKCTQAFQTLKLALTQAPVLRNPDFDKEFIVQVDASDPGIGAVLSQKNDEGEDHPIAYISRKLLPREVKYAIVEKECMAIVWSVRKFQPYLFGRQFVVQTDHNPLRWLQQMKNDNARLMRWSLALQAYPMKIEHRSGAKNGNADGLSRM